MAYINQISFIWSTFAISPSFSLSQQHGHFMVYLSNTYLQYMVYLSNISVILYICTYSLCQQYLLHQQYRQQYLHQKVWLSTSPSRLSTYPKISIIWSTLPMSIIWAALFQHLHQLVYLNQPHLHHMVTFGTSLLYVCSTLATSLSYLSNIRHLIYLTIIFLHHLTFEIRTKKGVTNHPRNFV